MNSTRALQTTALLGLLLALNGFVLGPVWLFGGGETFSQTASTWAFSLSHRVSWVLLTGLVVVVPTVLAHGPRRPAGWVAPVAQVAFAAQAATAFALGFVAPWLAGVAPALLDVSGGSFQVAMTTVWIGFILSMVALAVALARTGGVGRLAPALVAVGALVVPGAGPLGAGLVGLGLGVAARARLRATPPTPARATPDGTLTTLPR